MIASPPHHYLPKTSNTRQIKWPELSSVCELLWGWVTGEPLLSTCARKAATVTHMPSPCHCPLLVLRREDKQMSWSCPQLGSSARERSCSAPVDTSVTTQRALQGQNLPPGLGRTPESHLSCQECPKAGDLGLELPCGCYFLPLSLGLLL